ncbi:MAG: hypothetical protein WCV85_05485 [Patescibacteria group bacterium]
MANPEESGGVMLEKLRPFKWAIIALCVGGIFALQSKSSAWEDSVTELINNYLTKVSPGDSTSLGSAAADSIYAQGYLTGQSILSQSDIQLENQRVQKAFDALPDSSLLFLDLYLLGVEQAIADQKKQQEAKPRRRDRDDEV